jgi:hypothetical protein
MVESLVVQLLVALVAGFGAELLFEAVLPNVARRLREIWWVSALSRAPALWLLVPVWLVATGAIWWSVYGEFASGMAVFLFLALPALAAAVTMWRLRQPSRWHRSS